LVGGARRRRRARPGARVH